MLFALTFADNSFQDSGSALFANAPNTLMSGGTQKVSLSCELYKRFSR